MTFFLKEIISTCGEEYSLEHSAVVEHDSECRLYDLSKINRGSTFRAEECDDRKSLVGVASILFIKLKSSHGDSKWTQGRPLHRENFSHGQRGGL